MEYLLRIIRRIIITLCCVCIADNSLGQYSYSVNYVCVKENNVPTYYFIQHASFELENVTLRQYIYTISNGRLPVIYIGEKAFAECRKLKCVNIPSPLTRIDRLAFYNCILLDSVCFSTPDWSYRDYHLETIGDNVFQGCWKLKYINFPVDVKTIGRSAFLDCWSLPAIDIPHNVKTIGDYAFKNCKSLKSVVLSTSMSILGECVFQNCTALKSVGFYNKQPLRIKPLAFDSCISLEEVTIAYDKVYAIDSGAFKNCKSLKNITIPAGIKQGIGASVFEGCATLDTVTALIEQPYAFGKDAFKGISPTCVLMVPYGKRAAYIAAGWTEEVFKGGVKEIIPAGISQVKVSADAKEVGCYDLQGRRIQTPKKGLNIIRYNDGTTRKVMK